MKFQKGQSIVEFAFILPFFLFIFFSIIHLCGIFADYLYLSAIVRDSARMASVVSTEEYQRNGYNSVYQSFKDARLPVDFYDWNPADANDFDVSYVTKSNNVQVKVWAKMKKDSGGTTFVNIINNLGELMGNDTNITDRFDLKITYEMYSENKQTK